MGGQMGAGLWGMELTADEHQTTYVLLHTVPKTATAADVRRALVDHKLVNTDYAVTNSTSWLFPAAGPASLAL